MTLGHAIETFNICKLVYPRMWNMPFVLLWGMLSITFLRYRMWHTIAMIMCRIPRCRNPICRIQMCRISVCRIPMCRNPVCSISICRISVCNWFSNMHMIIVPSVHISMLRLCISNMYLSSLCPWRLSLVRLCLWHLSSLNLKNLRLIYFRRGRNRMRCRINKINMRWWCIGCSISEANPLSVSMGVFETQGDCLSLLFPFETWK